MSERSALATVLGIPPLAAIAIAAVLTALGVVVDVLRIGTVGIVFSILYVLGCVLAVTWVRRRNLFGPMVQPPLLLVVLIPVVVLLLGKSGTSVTETVLLVGAPLVNAFPTMAVGTGAALLIGLVRVVLQRPGDDDAADRLERAGVRGDGNRADRPGKPGQSVRPARPSEAGRAGRVGQSDRTGGGTAREAGRGGPPERGGPTGRAGQGATSAARAGQPGRPAGSGQGSGARQPAPRDEWISGRRGPGGAPGAGRTSGSPRRS